MANTTFSLRINPEDYEMMAAIASLRNQPVAELAREMIADGVKRMLDPAEIDRAIEEERARLQAAAEQIRAAQQRNESGKDGAGAS